MQASMLAIFDLNGLGYKSTGGPGAERAERAENSKIKAHAITGGCVS